MEEKEKAKHAAFETKSIEKKDAKAVNSKLPYIVGSILLAVIIIGIVYYVISISANSVVAAGDTVSVYYTGMFTNGTVFSTNVGSAPFNFTVGAGQVITGFNNAVIGMRVGENKTVTIPPSEAYGEVNQSLIENVPLSLFGNATVKTGMFVTSPNGQHGTIIGVSSKNATVDFNPPLAGYTLVFNIKIAAIKK